MVTDDVGVGLGPEGDLGGRPPTVRTVPVPVPARARMPAVEVVEPTPDGGATEPTSPPARWRRVAPLAGLAVLAMVLAVVVRAWLVPLGTGNADEGVYVQQSEWLRSGQLTVSTDDVEPFFRPWLTGERDGRVFFQYQPAWPAVIAVTDAATGLPWLASVLCFGGLVVAVHALALEALRSRRTALVAAALTALSPLFVLHAALTLAYLFTTLLATLALWCGLHVAHDLAEGDPDPSPRAIPFPRHLGWPLATGALLGVLLLTRPLDAALTAGLVGLAVLVLGTTSPRRLLAIGMVAAVAGAPFLLLAAWHNLRVTGSPARFPLTTSDPLNRFGFGDRRMQIGTTPIEYPIDEAWRSLGDNLRGAIGWVFGGGVAVALAVVAVVLPRRRGTRMVLLAAIVVYPAAYFFWWATSLAANGATNGLGPHYYVPAFVPLIVLTADGICHLWDGAHRRLTASWQGVALAGLLVTVLVGATLLNLPDKVDSNRAVTGLFESVDDALPDDLDDAVVIIRIGDPSPFVEVRFPFLFNGPDLDGPVIWAGDLGNENALLLADTDRQVYLLHRQLEPGDDLLAPSVVLTPLQVGRGGTIELSATVGAPWGDGLTGARVSVDGVGGGVPLPNTGEALSATLVAAGTLAADEDVDVDDPSRLVLDAGPHEVTLSVDRETPSGTEVWERRYEVMVTDDGEVLAVHPGLGWHRVDFGTGPIWIAEEVSQVLADVGP